MLSLSQEPCLKYTLHMLADRGTSRDAWTSFRLRSEVLFLETAQRRYQLWTSAEGGSGGGQPEFDRYSFAQVRDASSMVRSITDRIGYPLGDAHIDPIDADLDWTQIQWGPKTVYVNKKPYVFLRMWWRKRGVPDTSAATADSATGDSHQELLSNSIQGALAGHTGTPSA